MNSPSPSRLARASKLALFTLLPVAGLLLAGHVTALLITHRELAFEVDSLSGSTVYRTRLGRSFWSHRSETRLNSLGFPDQEYANLPPKGSCFHVVMAGDSFTFGDMTDGTRTWVSLLRDRVSALHRGRCVRFFNIAAPVTTIEQQANRVREVANLLDPDLVILGQYQNDITDLTNWGAVAYRPATSTVATTNWGDRIRGAVPGFDSPLPRLLTYRAFKFFLEHGIRVDVLRRWSVLADSSNAEYGRGLTDIYTRLFGELANELREAGVGFGVVIMPSKMDLMAKRYPEGDFFESLARAQRIPAHSVFARLDAHRDPMPFYTFDGHLNEIGNALVAADVYDWLFGGHAAPFPELRAAAGPALPPVYVRGFPR